MSNFYTFFQSVMGYSHITKGIVCQDSSKTYQNENYRIAIVSDGHGDPSCFRSDVGSKTAVDISMDSLKIFANEMLKNMDDEQNSLYKQLMIDKQCKKIIKQLTDNIISKWYDTILEDHKNNPPTESEYAQAKNYAEVYKKGEKLPHIYGATLIIGLWVKDILILIQQGDGGCTVFFEDGTIEQPIPEDVNCHANITTSLCDENALDGIRHYIVDLSKKNAIACFLGSDGVEDSYTNVEGNHIFYKELMHEYFIEFNEDKEKFGLYLQEYFPKFSQSGSADDVSVAVIIEEDKMKSAVKDYSNDINKYNNQQKFNVHNEKVVSMTRKHKILSDNLQKEEMQLQQLQKKYKALQDEKIKVSENFSNAKEKVKLFNKTQTDCEIKISNLNKRKVKLQSDIESKKDEYTKTKDEHENLYYTKEQIENELKRL